MTKEQRIEALLSHVERLLSDDDYSTWDCQTTCPPVEVGPVDGWRCYKPGPVTHFSLLLVR